VTNPQKQKGSLWERQVAQYFRERGFAKVQRRYGAGAQADRGDLEGINDVVIECKDHKKLTLSVFADETEAEKINAKADLGICVIKRARKGVEKAYVLLSLEDIATLLAEAGR
jgi:Holliday junction resolvase